VAARVQCLRDSLRMTIYVWVARGLFERHKLILMAQLTFNLMNRGVLGEENKLNPSYLQFLMRGPRKVGEDNTIGWLPDSAWAACQALCDLDDFGTFCASIHEAQPRFQEWFNLVEPEKEKLPLDWAALDKEPFKKMVVVRCLRPDRMTVMLNQFIRNTLPDGDAYADSDGTLNTLEILDQSIADSTPATPIYFILSAGANVVGDLDILAKKYGFEKGLSYQNVSMGQGQDVIAERYLDAAHREGHWVILNNIHLMPKWLIALEKRLDDYIQQGSNDAFRLYVTSDPSNGIPIGILNRCIKLCYEAPAGLKAGLKGAFCTFDRSLIEDSDGKTRSILFGLCLFHAILISRKGFGTMGYNMKYPFAIGDLRDSATCLTNYMENSSGGKVPWEDLKYIFGEIMYGGHIVNDFDRIMAMAYLDFYMKDELLDETEMFPYLDENETMSFKCPAPTQYDKYLAHIDEKWPGDTPLAFGLHPNAEIDVRTQQSEVMFQTLLNLQPREAGTGEGIASPQSVAETVAADILERFGEVKYDLVDITSMIDGEADPYQNVFLQEMQVMNVLLEEMKRSLKELQQGHRGELTMSDKMEALQNAIFNDAMPAAWSKISWPSMRPLSTWLVNFAERLDQINNWTGNPTEIPRSTWCSGFFNPQAFITAILQVTAQRNQWELDKLVSMCDMTKVMDPAALPDAAKDGAYIHGLAMQGARWNIDAGLIERSKPKEMYCRMPVMCVRGISADRADNRGYYLAPVYKTEGRGPTFVFCAQLKTKIPKDAWIVAGVGLLMDVV
jgi:dynein heavy chain